MIEYGAERKISRHSVLGATVSVGVPQGVSLKIKQVHFFVEFALLQRLSGFSPAVPVSQCGVLIKMCQAAKKTLKIL